VFSDLHVGHDQFARRHFKQFIDRHKDHPYTYFIGLGDQLDCIIQSDYKRFRLSGIDSRYRDSETPDELINMQIKDLCDLLEPIRGRLLGLICGNHEDKLNEKHGINVHRLVCSALGVDNLGYSCLLLLKLANSEGPGRVRSVRIYCHHGYGGGGRTQGGAITKYSRFITEYDADVYLTAHDHDMFWKKIARVGINNSGQMVDRPVILANAGAFKKTLTDGDVPSWEETRGFPPRLLGGLVLEIEIDRHGWVDFSVIDG